MPKRFAVVNQETNIVENVIMLMNASEWGHDETVQGCCFVIESDSANIGDLYSNGEFVAQ